MTHLRPTRLAAFAALLLSAAGQWAGAQPLTLRGNAHESAHRGATREAPKGGSNNKGKIEGTKWTSEELDVKGQKVPAGSVKFEFTAAGKMTYWILDKPYTGRYTLGAGDTVTLDLDEELAGSKKHVQTIIIKDSKLKLIDTDGTTIHFSQTKK